jgi:hypothetical protein
MGCISAGWVPTRYAAVLGNVRSTDLQVPQRLPGAFVLIEMALALAQDLAHV